MTETKGYVIPISPDPDLEKLNKKSMAYRKRLRKLACILCANIATQILIYELDGCTKLERYCDSCVSKQKEENQSTSGI